LYLELAQEVVESHFFYNFAQCSENLLEKRRATQDLTDKAERYALEYNEKKKRLREHGTYCKRVAPIRDEDGNSTELFEQLNGLPYETKEEAEAAMEEAQGKVDSIHNDPNAIRQYENTLKEIDLVQGQLEEVQNSKDNWNKVILETKASWKQSLDTAVQKVDELFVEYMSEVGCTGE